MNVTETLDSESIRAADHGLTETTVTFPVSGERFVFTSPVSDSSRFAFDFFVAPGGGVFQEHKHVAQLEIMRCVAGELEITVDGELVRLAAGDEARLPEGAAHTLVNKGEVEAHCEVEYRPAGRNREWFQLIAAFEHRTGREPSIFDLAPFLLDVDIFMPGPTWPQRFVFRYFFRPLSIALGRRRRMLAIASEAYGRSFTWA